MRENIQECVAKGVSLVLPVITVQCIEVITKEGGEGTGKDRHIDKAERKVQNKKECIF